MRHLAEVTIAATQAALERTHLANEKLHLEQELRLHEARVAEFVHEKMATENCLLRARECMKKEVYPRCCVENLRSLCLSICLFHYMEILILKL
jgi:hypothetical protein